MNHILQKKEIRGNFTGIVDYDETCSGYLCEDGSIAIFKDLHEGFGQRNQ